MKYIHIVLVMSALSVCNWRCDESRCNDGRRNGTEEFVDCGGECEPCYTCSDGYLNRDETQLDCGGAYCAVCPMEWEPLSMPQGLNFSDMFALNDNVLFGLSIFGQIAKSTNGGLNWTVVQPTQAGGDFRNIHFFDDTHGVAVGATYFNGNAFGSILSTSDGGQTWQQREGNFSGPQLVSFAPPQQIYVYAGNQYVAVSKDGGGSFKLLEPSDFPGIPLESQTWFFQVKYFDAGTGYAVIAKLDNSNNFAGTFLYRTQDGGQNWNVQASLGYLYPYTVNCYSPQLITGVVPGAQRWSVSTNGGQQFNEITADGNRLYFSGSQTAYLFPSSPPFNDTHYVLQSTDAGANWQPFGLYNRRRWENYEYPRTEIQFLQNGPYLYAFGDGRLVRIKTP